MHNRISLHQSHLRSFNASVKNTENTQKGGQKGHFKPFFEPWLAQASLWLTWAPKWLRGEVTNSHGRAKLLQGAATDRLGELQVHQVPSFPINRREGG